MLEKLRILPLIIKITTMAIVPNAVAVLANAMGLCHNPALLAEMLPVRRAERPRARLALQHHAHLAHRHLVLLLAALSPVLRHVESIVVFPFVQLGLQ